MIICLLISTCPVQYLEIGIDLLELYLKIFHFLTPFLNKVLHLLSIRILLTQLTHIQKLFVTYTWNSFERLIRFLIGVLDTLRSIEGSTESWCKARWAFYSSWVILNHSEAICGLYFRGSTDFELFFNFLFDLLHDVYIFFGLKSLSFFIKDLYFLYFVVS